MGLLPSLKNEERIGNRWVKEEEVPKHILNRKADKKLDYVADLYSMAIDDKLTDAKARLLNRTLYCEGFRFIKYLNLNYTYENRLWAFSYNLNYKTTIELSDNFVEIKPCKFIVKNKGKMAVMDAQWLDGGSECSEEERNYYLNRLNSKLIIDRIVDLDMTNVEVAYNPVMKHWTISCRTLIGSTTWLLIPPVMHLIKPKPVECVRMLEFLELVANAVIKKDDKLSYN